MKVKKLLQTILIIVPLAMAPAARAGNVVIKAKLDSTHLLMGRTTALHLEIVEPKDAVGRLLISDADTLTAAIEIADRPKGDTTDIGNGRHQINRDLILQAFDSGLYVIPPIRYAVDKEVDSTNALALKVIPVKVDTTQEIIGIKPVEGVPYKFFDWVPQWLIDYWWIALLVLLLLAALLAYLYFKRKNVNPLKPLHKRLPPYEEAMQRLEALKARQLWQQGQEKAYYTELTDILREYIDRRFSVNAVEMTSTEIIATLKANGETKAVDQQLAMILEMADYVKFAAQKPLADDNEVAYQRAVNFVEQTRPVVAPEPASAGKEVKS